MRLRTASILGAGAPLIGTGAVSAAFLGVNTVALPTGQFDPDGAGPRGAVPVHSLRLYAVFDRPGQDVFMAAAGTPDSPMDIHIVGGGTFFQHPFGSDKAPNAAAVSIFPSLAYDTFVTIGVAQVGNAPGAPPGSQYPDLLVLTPQWPGFAPSAIGGTDLAWAVWPNSPQANPFNPDYVAGNGQVLIGQFSTTSAGALSGMFLVSVRSNNEHVLQAIDVFAEFVPGPGSLLPLGAAGLLGARRRRRA